MVPMIKIGSIAVQADFDISQVFAAGQLANVVQRN